MLSIASDGIQETEVTELSYRITSCSLSRPAPTRVVPGLFAPAQPPLAWVPASLPAARYPHPWMHRPVSSRDGRQHVPETAPVFFCACAEVLPAISSRSA